jgi:hypothetical protein
MWLASDKVDALVELALVLAGLGMALQLLRLNAWRAWLFLFPTRVRLRPVDPGPVPPALVPWVEQLRALGFVPVGGHVQHSPLHRGVTAHDFAHADERVFASLYLSARGDPRVYLLSPVASGDAVLTDGAPASPLVLAGLARAAARQCPPVARVLALHRERMRGREAVGEFTGPGRLAAGHTWLQGPGQREIRRQSLPGLLWTILALALVASLLLGGGRPV